MKIILFKIIIIFFLVWNINSNQVFAAYPGDCVNAFFTISPQYVGVPGSTGFHDQPTLNLETGTVVVTGQSALAPPYQYYQVNHIVYYFESGTWKAYRSGQHNIPVGSLQLWLAAGFKQVTWFTPENIIAAQPSCSGPCEAKTGQSVYDLKSNISESSPLPALSCNDGCQVTSEIAWTQCINDNIDCLSSVKYTYNGNSCSQGDPTLNEGLTPDPPNNCQFEIADKIAECGGSLNISSYDFQTCTGVCVPDPCHDKWLALVNKCGGVMGVSNWNAETCTGICSSDPLPNNDVLQPPDSPDAQSPDAIQTTTKTNLDGSKEVIQTVTNNITDGSTQTTTTTTYYDSSNVQTGQSKVTVSTPAGINPSTGEQEPNYPVPDSWYTPSYDTSGGLISSINFQQVSNATSAFKETAPYQITNLITQCLEHVEGHDCTYPPRLNIDLFGSLSSREVNIDLSAFSTVVNIIKFFFAILCLVGTGKLVMNLFE